MSNEKQRFCNYCSAFALLSYSTIGIMAILLLKTLQVLVVLVAADYIALNEFVVVQTCATVFSLLQTVEK